MTKSLLSLFSCCVGPKCTQQVNSPVDMKTEGEEQEQEPSQECLEYSDLDTELNMADESYLNTISVKGTAGPKHDGQIISSSHVSVSFQCRIICHPPNSPAHLFINKALHELQRTDVRVFKGLIHKEIV